jgi:GntR family transcriptional regulator, transcriptional repressor for pyruvate dehydrogenase complex
MPKDLAGMQELDLRSKEPAYAQVADQLRSLIVRGKLELGARLPNETELSSMFGVSRSTTREALRVLSSQNLVTTTRGVGGGSFVVHPRPEDISEFLEISIGLLSHSEMLSVADLLEARVLLEVPAARLAAERRTEMDLQVLRETLEKEVDALRRPPAFEDHRRFHQAIQRASGNPLLEIMTRPVFTVLRTRFLRDQAPRRFWRRVAEDHRGILERIEAGDQEGAARAMREHIGRLAGTYERIDRAARRARS